VANPGTQGGDQANPANVPAALAKPKQVTRFELAFVLKKTGGDRTMAAEVCGMTVNAINLRISKDEQLSALYGDPARAASVEVSPAEAMQRSMGEVAPPAPSTIELASIVSEADNEILRAGLEKLGVSPATIEKFKNLDALAKTSGHFLSVSLEKVHRMYFLQLVNLMELGDSIRARLMIPVGQEGYLSDEEARAYANKNYIDIVKTTGDGYKNMLQGAQAIVAMLKGSSGEDPKGAKRKPGFSKLVSPPRK
jgi:hypothetical protein